MVSKRILFEIGVHKPTPLIGYLLGSHLVCQLAAVVAAVAAGAVVIAGVGGAERLPTSGNTDNQKT
jgi:hypothetical protein